MYRHLIERAPFDVHIATNAEHSLLPQSYLQLELPYVLQRLRKSRFGPALKSWLMDYENLIWPHTYNRQLEQLIESYRPDVILALADNCLAEIAARAAERHRLPLAGLFLDWVPIMDGYFGHKWTSNRLSTKFRSFYERCDLAFCTSDGMQEELGPHPNSHIIYPMPGQHRVPARASAKTNKKFRLVYVGSVQNFYGRMICSLLESVDQASEIEFIVIGPEADWPKATVDKARENGTYLGFKPPEEAAEVLASADALLVVMSFEKKYELFMRTSFTTKFLDYTAFSKPIILWGPRYCTPVQVSQKHGGALVVDQPSAELVVSACQTLATDQAMWHKLASEASHLRATLFNPDRLQGIFVSEIEKLAHRQENRKIAA